MKINFTKKQMKQLIRLAEAGNWLINSHRDEEVEEYEGIYQYILEAAKKMGLEEVDYDKQFDMHYLDPEVEEEMQELVEEYDRYTFYEELPMKLAKRDYEKEKHLRNDDEKSYVDQISELEEKYIDEFLENGLDNLVIKKK